jgi:anti-sigma B factor antagonist
MQFEVEKRENYTLVRVLTDKLDANNSTDLKSQLVFISGQGEKNIVLDLSLCKYCDSSGLRAVLVANRLCEEAIGACIISGLQPDVENIFRISMLHTVLLITTTVEDAEDLLKKKEMFKPDVKNNDI